jgi:putative ABC transport system substrate-binding protein
MPSPMMGPMIAARLLVLLALMVAPLAAEAQPATKTSRIGYLSPNSASEPENRRRLGALREGLRDLGYVEGQNITIESRWAEGEYGRLPDLAAELVHLKVDVIVTYAPPAIQAAKQATGTIPIVMAGIIDPVATGFVASLARPGGNITGLSLMAPEMVGKQLEILKEAIPEVTRVAVLGNPANAGNSPQLRHAQEAARALKVRLQLLEVRGPNEIDSAFAKMIKERVGAVVVLVDAMLINQRTRVADLAARHRLPSIFGLMDFVEAGGLIFYGANDASRFRRAAMFVHKILKGAKPADLPVEQPTKFELVINLKTAKALGLTIPLSLLLRADQVIE